MNGLKRTSYCGKLSKANVGNSEVVCGWVQKQRDKGHLIFIDLRDRTGVVQLVFDDDTNREVFEKVWFAREKRSTPKSPPEKSKSTSMSCESSPKHRLLRLKSPTRAR